ncbi:LysR family transcriptional regulator [Dongshaea marina]|uniref:LysR family transcriptional regulator n=1 Tax=Dongshaea marina TaxID=2047966 RepID=UPI000D3EAFAC|nr:LysR family transcriptional regulator [Dongshaea marina]
MPSLETLHCFLCVARHLSFAKAAQELGYAHSSISRKISQLEQELGVSLFTRSTRSVTLTDAGSLLQEEAKSTLETFDGMFERVRELGEYPRGKVRIACPSIYAEWFLPPLLAELRARWPELKLEVMTDEKLVDLVSGEADFSIRMGVPSNSSLIAQKICDVDYWLLASREYLARHPAITSPKDLLKHNLLAFKVSSYHQQWYFDQEGKREAIPIGDSAFKTNDARLMLSMVRLGEGISMIGSVVGRQEVKSQEMVRVLPEYQMVPHQEGSCFYILYTRERGQLYKVRVVIDFLLKKLRELHQVTE